MRNPRPTCPNPACVHHTKPPANFFRKKGYRYPKHNYQPIPCYQCKACGRKFCATQVKPIEGQHRPEFNRRILEMAVSGVSGRRIAKLLGCSQNTVLRKIENLADQAREQHIKRLATIQTSYVMMDELETFIHARWKQVSIPLVVRPKTGEILAFGVARTPSKMAKGIQFNRWVIDDRPQVVPTVLATVGPCLRLGGTIATDGGSSYPKWVKRYLPGVNHNKEKTPIGNTDYDPLFSVNVLFAKMRNDLARLGRKTWTTTKTVEGLENHLWLYVAWTNSYKLC
jgi:transposase-like protein